MELETGDGRTLKVLVHQPARALQLRGCQVRSVAQQRRNPFVMHEIRCTKSDLRA